MVGKTDVHEPGPVGEHRVRKEFEEREQDEGSFVHPGMRNGERSVGDGQAVDEEDVDVDGARAPADLAGAAELGFDTVTCGEEIVRLEIGADLDDDVQEVVLLGTAHGIGLPNARAALNVHTSFCPQQVERALQRLEAAPDV